MVPTRLILAGLAFTLAASCATPHSFEPAAPTASLEQDLPLRSDLPLRLEDGTDDVTPRSFASDDSFGCLSLIKFGDWQQTFNKGEFWTPPPVWWRVSNYGVMHCAAVFSSSAERNAPGGGFEFGFFLKLGRDDSTNLDLYAWEIGLRTGSSYLLLAAPPSRTTLESFAVLDADCSHGEVRKANEPSVWRTDYCTIPSADALRDTARLAAQKPPLGRLIYVGPSLKE